MLMVNKPFRRCRSPNQQRQGREHLTTHILLFTTLDLSPPDESPRLHFGEKSLLLGNGFPLKKGLRYEKQTHAPAPLPPASCVAFCPA
jgi:hypothetical protein